MTDSDIGRRIKLRREELHMTQTELATLAGFASKSSVAKMEKGVQGLKQSKIAPVAKALRVSPAWILGFEVKDESRAKALLLEMFERLPDEGKVKLLDQAELLSLKYKSDSHKEAASAEV